MKKRSGGRSSKATANDHSVVIFRWSWTIFMVLLTSVPHLINWWRTPAGFQYTWILPPYPEDSFGYLAWAEQAARGALLFKIKYTALPHDPFLFHPLFLVCGWLGALLSGHLGVAFWIVKAIGVVLFFNVLYRYLDYLDLGRAESIVASVLTGIASGVGGILYLLGVQTRWAMMSTDLWMPETITFWSLLWNPLFAFSLTLMLLSIFWLDRGTREARPADLWRSGLACGVLTLLHPYSAPVLFTLAVVLCVVRQRKRSIGYLIRYFVLALPFAIYMAGLSRLNPILARHSETGNMASPPPYEYALGLGLPLALLIIALLILRGDLLRRYWQIVLWFVLAVALAFAPVWFQRKLIFGAQIPLCIVSAVFLCAVMNRWLGRFPTTLTWTIAAIVLLPLFATTSCQVLANAVSQVSANEDGAYYVSDEIISGLDVLQQRSTPDDVVLATPATSRVIPSMTGNTVVWGHWAMSIDYKDRQATLARVLDSRSDVPDEERARVFWGNDIRFLFADGKLLESMQRYPFLWKLILRDSEKIFENSSVVIYQRPATL